jgi:hypothetical protein
MQTPLVKRAMELIGAQFVQMDEGFGAALAAPAERQDVTDPHEE